MVISDADCRYMVSEFWTSDDFNCSKHNMILSEELTECIHCKDFEPRQCCNDCIHAMTKSYETGTLDEIDYYCTLQDNKLIYEDISFNCYNPEWPKCPIGKFKEEI